MTEVKILVERIEGGHVATAFDEVGKMFSVRHKDYRSAVGTAKKQAQTYFEDEQINFTINKMDKGESI